MRKLHLALATTDIEATVRDYSSRLGQEPDLIVPQTYALWRTEQLNLSVRNTGSGESGTLRHLGWEADDAEAFTCDVDCNGILWERFAPEHQAKEIKDAWPDVEYEPKV